MDNLPISCSVCVLCLPPIPATHPPSLDPSRPRMINIRARPIECQLSGFFRFRLPIRCAGVRTRINSPEVRRAKGCVLQMSVSKSPSSFRAITAAEFVLVAVAALGFLAGKGQPTATQLLGKQSPQNQPLTNREAVLVLQSPAPATLSPRIPTGAPPSLSAIRLQLLGSNSNPQIVGAEKLSSSSNYLLGNVPRRWHSHIPQYSQVRYRRIYPGTDLIYYGR